MNGSEHATCFACLTMTEGPLSGLQVVMVGCEPVIAELVDFLTSISVNLEEGKTPICRCLRFEECGQYNKQAE